MGGNSQDVRGAQQLAEALLRDLERIAERSVTRMQELLPSYAKVPAAKLLPVTSTNTRNLLEAVRDPDPDPTRAEDHFWVWAKTRVTQGIAADEMLQAWRIGLEVVREEAHPVASQLAIGDDALLEFVEATMQWGGTLFSAACAEVSRLAEEQAALRRVATLVARGARPDDVFTAVVKEVAGLLPVTSAAMGRFEPDGTVTTVAAWSLGEVAFPIGRRRDDARNNVTGTVLATGRPARLDDFSDASGPIGVQARNAGYRSAVGSPITVEGRLWGVVSAASSAVEPLPVDTEARLASFSELVATAIANSESRSGLARLAEEQAALRRVATLVAQDASPSAVLDAVAAEMQRLLDADAVTIGRYEAGDEMTVVAHRSPERSLLTIGTRVNHEGKNVTAMVRRTGQPARLEHLGQAHGGFAELFRGLGMRQVVGAPIVVGGRLWGTILGSWSREEPLPADTEERMVRFAELLATAIANADSREALRRLADEQAALRRVATLVAEGAPPTAVFDAVAAELAGLLQADHVVVCRYEPGSELTVLAYGGASQEVPPGARINHEGDSVEAVVWRTERSAQVESYEGARGMLAELARAAGVQAAVGAPVVLDGRLWGVASVGWNWGHRPPADAEERMAKFAELLETAIANADSRNQLTASRARLVTEADQARRRVVRDLHDGAQQRLVHTIVTLKLAQRALRDKDEKAQSLIAEALGQAQQGNAELRELAHGILPPVLTDGGLRAGVATVVARLDLPVEVDVPAERFPEELEASAYFVVAEALTNVVKHSHADSAAVRAFVDGGMLRVEVRDDGLGGADPDGHGLVGLGDRVAALGGQLTVESPAGGGTVLVATLPLAAN